MYPQHTTPHWGMFKQIVGGKELIITYVLLPSNIPKDIALGIMMQKQGHFTVFCQKLHKILRTGQEACQNAGHHQTLSERRQATWHLNSA